MLSISKPIRAGNGEYYLSLAATDDYYLDAQEPPGFWLGGGAAALGLPRHLEPKHFRNLLRGLSPDGEIELVKNTRSPAARRAGWDATWSAPKSVSTAWSQAPPELRVKIEAAIRLAVERAIEHVETLDIVSRTGTKGIHRHKAKLLFAVFPHTVSRNGEPQLHFHSILLNIGVRPDGTTGTLEPKALFQHKMLLGALFRVELAYQLESSLGLRSIREGRSFELLGVDRELMAAFSSRRKEILEELARIGATGGKAAAVAALATRSQKEAIPREQLFKQWREKGLHYHWSEKELSWLINAPFPKRDMDREIALVPAEALAELTNDVGHFLKRDLFTAVLQGAQGRGFNADQALGLAEGLFQSPDLVPLPVLDVETRYTTKEVLKLEKDVLETAKAMAAKGAQCPLPSPALPETSLSPEQQNALATIVSPAPGGLVLLRGVAGAGKTTVFKAAHEFWNQQGLQVIGGALSGKAASELKTASDIPAQTLHSLLWEINGGFCKLTPRTVLVVDEAAMVGTRQLLSVLRHCQAAGTTCILAGDDRQLQAIEHGGGFSALLKHLPSADLTQIFRQKEAWARQAVVDFMEGQAAAALETYKQRGLVSESLTEVQSLARLVGDWRSHGVRVPQDHVIMAPLNHVVAELNQLAQEQRIQEGVLSGRSVQVNGKPFYVGDRVLFTRNDRALGVWNGETGRVQSVEGAKLQVQVDSKDGNRGVEVDTRSYRDLRHGYAITVNRAQGTTLKNSLIYAASQTRELAYVEASRARENTHWYLSEPFERASKDMGISRKKEFASELGATLKLELKL
jgi:conjugative relaxase-like TrwC/TraI family protein